MNEYGFPPQFLLNLKGKHYVNLPWPNDLPPTQFNILLPNLNRYN
jgi:hypothetical protein